MRTAILFLFLFPALLCELHAETGKPLQQLVPRDSLALIEIPDISKVRSEFDKSDFGKLLAETQLEALFGQMLEPLWKMLDEKLQKEFELTLKQLQSLLAGQVGIALIGVDKEADLPRFLFSMEFGKNQQLVAKLIQKFASGALGEMKLTTRTYKERTITTAKGRSSLSWVLADGRMLMSLHEKVLEGAIDRIQGNEQTSLDSVSQFSGLSGKDAKPVMLMLVNLAAIWKQHWQDIPEEAQSVMTVLGIKHWRALIYRQVAAGGPYFEQVRLFTDKPDEGLIGVLAPTALEGKTASPLSGRRVAHGAGRFDLPAIYKLVQQVVKTVDREAYAEMRKSIDEFETKAGFKVDALLGSIGKQYENYSQLPKAGLVPQTVTRLWLADQKTFFSGIQALAKLGGFELVTAQVKGRTVHHWRTPLGKLGRDNPLEKLDAGPEALLYFLPGFLPSHFYFDDSGVVFSDMHQNLVEFIEGGYGNGWRTDQPLGKGTVTIGATHGGKLFAGFYGSIMPLFGSIEGLLRGAGVNFDVRKLPRPQAFMRPSASSSWGLIRGEKQITFYTRGMFGGGGSGIFVGGIAAAMLLPVLNKVKEKANRSNCKSNLKQLGLGLILYRDSQGKGSKYPRLDRMLTELYNAGTTSEPELFACPSSGREVTEEQLKAHDHNALSYVSTPFPIRTVRGASARPIVWDRKGNHQGKRVVLFLDLHVEEVDEARFQRMMVTLAAQEKKLKAQGLKPYHVQVERTWKDTLETLRKQAVAPSAEVAKQIVVLLEQLDDSSWARRRSASRELSKLGAVAIKALLERHAKPRSLEQKNLIKQILLKLSQK